MKEKGKKKGGCLTVIIAAFVLIILIGVFTSGNSEDKPKKVEPVDLTGTWRSENNDGSYHEAVISEDTIEINWITDDGDTKSLYWVGTYEAPTEATEEYKWTSEKDIEKTSGSLFASGDDTKEFTYENGILSYSSSMMGVTTTMKLEQVNDDTSSNTVTDTNEDTRDVVSEPETPSVQTWDAGMHKVGTDIPVGEYVLKANGYGYFQISSDSSGELDSIVANDNFTTNSIVTVQDGQYLTLNDCTAYKMGEEPTLDTTKEGMFKVGVHLPAGEYKVHSDGRGYVEVSSSSSHLLDNIVTNDNIEGDSYITVSDGQYLKLSDAYIVQ